MGRQKNVRQVLKPIVFLVDGQDEKWYLEKVREHYKPEVLKKIKILPELATKKKVKDLIEEAHRKIEDGCNKVFLILDFDDPLKFKEEMKQFKLFYDNYCLVKDSAKFNGLSTKMKNRLMWMGNLQLIVNSPCLEYWYLLHDHKTTKFYKTYAELLPDLKKLPKFRDYVKEEKYYKSNPDIYVRLGGEDALLKARKNYIPFDKENCENMGFSEMAKVFDFFDTLS